MLLHTVLGRPRVHLLSFRRKVNPTVLFQQELENIEYNRGALACVNQISLFKTHPVWQAGRRCTMKEKARRRIYVCTEMKMGEFSSELKSDSSARIAT